MYQTSMIRDSVGVKKNQMIQTEISAIFLMYTTDSQNIQ